MVAVMKDIKSNKKRGHISRLVLMSFFLANILTQPAVANLKNIVIAYQGPLSGEEASVGIAQLDAVKYAVHQFNEVYKGKINVSIVTLDDLGSGAEATRVAPSIAANKSIIGMVGPAYSGATIASLPFYKQSNLPMISPSATRMALTDPAQGLIGFPVFHRVAMIDKQQGPLLYRIATDGVVTPRVFLIDDQSPYGVGLAQFIKNAPGALISGSDSVPDRTTDWSLTISKIKATNANVVIFSGYYAQAALLFRQLRDSGFKGVIAGGDGVFSPGILTLAPNSTLEGVRLTSGTLSSLSQINQNLENSFRTLTKRSSDYYSAEAIDSTNVLLTCIAKGSETRSEMLDCIDGFTGRSITGRTISFDANGDLAESTGYAFEIKSGTFRLRDNFGMAFQSLNEVLTGFPWYSVYRQEIEAKAREEEEARIKQEAEARTKAEFIARSLRENRETCLALNIDLNRTRENVRSSALVYTDFSKVFDDLFKKLPQPLDCESLDVISFESNFSTQRDLLVAYKVALANGISIAEVAIKQKSKTSVKAGGFEKNTITCVKGKLIKRVTAKSPKCPTGYKLR